MKQIVYILIIVLLISCKSNTKYKKPENLIGKNQMIDLLYDMHLANGAGNIKNVNLEKNKNYMALVYEKYHIDSIAFSESNMYYYSNIEQYEEIYLEVQKRLKKLQEEYEKEQDSLLKMTRDSIRNNSKFNKKKFKGLNRSIKEKQKEINSDSIRQAAKDSENIQVKKDIYSEDQTGKTLH